MFRLIKVGDKSNRTPHEYWVSDVGSISELPIDAPDYSLAVVAKTGVIYFLDIDKKWKIFGGGA